MKVLFLTNVPSPYRVEFFNELGKLCDLTVLYELEYATDRDKNWKANGAVNFKEVYLKGKRTGTDSALCYSVIEYLKDKTYDVVVIGGYSTPTGMLAIQYLKFKRRRFIISCDGGMVKETKGMKHGLKKYFISAASAWLSTGSNTTEYLINYGADKNNIFIYPFTSVKKEDIDERLLNVEEKNQVREELGIKENKVIICVGQFIHRKGFDLLIKAMAELPKEIGVYMVGGEPTEEYIQLREKYALNNLHFEGFKTKNQLNKYYEAGDLFVLPTREDIWGLVVNEAMAKGLPVITTNKCVAGTELIENDKNGIIVEGDNVNQLAEAVAYVINDEAKRKLMAENSLKKIQGYTITSMAERHLEIFKEFIGS